MARASDPTRARAGATWIVRVLRDHGHAAYFAGGCVRDGLLGLHPTDFDVATDAPPKRVSELFPRSSEVGASFGVVLVHVPEDKCSEVDGPRQAASTERPQRVSVEVATFRSDGPYSDARRPDSVRFSDAKSDAERRDFTINALFLDPFSGPTPAGAISHENTDIGATSDLRGTVIDYVGGVDDLRAKVLRAVGDPEQRLAEDHLRALRAVRFAARLGFDIEPGTASAIRARASDLRGVSRERIGDELRRMLAHPARAQAIAILQSLQLDAPVLNEPAIEAELRLLRALGGGATISLAASLGAWLVDRLRPVGATTPAWPIGPGLSERVGRLRRSLSLSNEETDALKAALASAGVLANEWGNLPIARRKRLATSAGYPDGLALLRAWSPERADEVMETVQSLSLDGIGLGPPPLLTGDDLVASGWKPNPKFKGVLEQVYDAQLEGQIATKTQAMELAARLNV